MAVLNMLLMGRHRWGVTLDSAMASLDRGRALFADLGSCVAVVGLRVDQADHFDWLTDNQLLTSQAFWKKLPAFKLLIYQTDTLMIEPPDPALFT